MCERTNEVKIHLFLLDIEPHTHSNSSGTPHDTKQIVIMTEEYHHKHMCYVRLHTGSAVMMSVTMMMLTLVCMSGSGFFCFVNCRNCKGKVQTVFGSVAHRAHGGAPPEDREALNQPEQQVQTGTASS